MQLEDYFDFLAPDDIRLKGTRVGIETILYDYIHRGQTPEAIADAYPSLSLEQVYATILYYLHNREAVSAYLTDWLEWGRAQRRAQALNPPPVVVKLRRLKQQAAASVASDNSEYQDQGETDSADTRGRKLRDYPQRVGATRENPTGCSRGSVNYADTSSWKPWQLEYELCGHIILGTVAAGL